MAKITLLHYAAPPIVGGVESVIGHHARLMVAASHQVQIVAGRGEQTDERVPFIHLPLADSSHPDVLAIKAELDRGKVPSAFASLVEALFARLAEILVESDWLIAHNVCSLHKNLALTAALYRIAERQQRPRLILWHHDLAWTTERYRSELHVGWPWDLLRSDWPGVVQVTISEARRTELARLLEIPPERIHVIPNGLDARRFLKWDAQTAALVERLNLLEAAPLLLLPVRITPRKNIEFALQVLGRLRQRFPQARLVVSGPMGPHNPANLRYFETLKALRHQLGLDDAAHFLAEVVSGYLPDEVISDLYSLADLLLFPSREEGFGLPILEAGLVRVPAFCADIPPLRELGLDLVEYFSPDGSPAEVADRIAHFLASSRTFGLARRVRMAFTWERIYQEKIESLLSGGA